MVSVRIKIKFLVDQHLNNQSDHYLILSVVFELMINKTGFSNSRAL